MSSNKKDAGLSKWKKEACTKHHHVGTGYGGYYVSKGECPECLRDLKRKIGKNKK